MINEIILRAKRDPEQEYTLHLFEYCNLSCQFCWQDHDAKRGIETVPEKIKPIYELLDEEVRDSVCFNIMGGEIFADDVFLNLYPQYLDLAKALKYKCDLLGKSLKINWVTNLVNSRPDLVDKLVNECKLLGIQNELSTSYDPRGRFNKHEFDVFKNNLYQLKNIVGTVSILLTKNNINYFVSNSDNFFDQLYNDGFYIYFDYYMPDKNWNFSAPSDYDMYEFFKFCVDNYPKAEPIAGWIEQEFNYASCRTSKLVLDDGTKCNCGNLMVESGDDVYYKSTIRRNDNSEIENYFFNKYDCMTCEYMSKCSFGCFMERNSKYLDEMPTCVFKETFKYIDTKHSTVTTPTRKKIIPIFQA
jgi:sulfatase maturation enzyme AslB (radical SAM superfamily)